MAARELGRAGKKVTILEARSRVGGRIYPLDETVWGYPAQGGAEFVHSEGKHIKQLAREAGLTFVPIHGEIWSTRNGPLNSTKLDRYKSLINEDEKLKQKLKTLEKDISIGEFLDTHFGGEEYSVLRSNITKVAEGYDAADPYKISTFVLRDEWLGDDEWENGRIKEGYGALLAYLEKECTDKNVTIKLDSSVATIVYKKGEVQVTTETGAVYTASKVVVTVPLPLLSTISFSPAIPEKLASAARIGFGGVVKVLFKFKSQWWNTLQGNDLSKMSMLLTNSRFMTWWTQYPETSTTLAGWMGGPSVSALQSFSDQEIADAALDSLAETVQIEKETLRSQLETYFVGNWANDPYSRGAYSYSLVNADDAYDEMAEPIEDTLYFAGEAVNRGEESATVEAALQSGLQAAQDILKEM